jgi:DNA ligase (NAD+)
MHASLVRFDYKEADWLFEYVMELENTMQAQPGDNDGSKQTLQGMTVVITGKLTQFKNRSEMQSAIEQAGGKVGSSVTGNTKILVNNDNKSTSAKNVAAQKLGIPILTEQEFVEKYL